MRKAFRIGLFCLTAALLMPTMPVYAQCVNPAGNEGDMAFNETHKVAQYCDSAGWVAMLPPITEADCTEVGEVCSDGTIYAGLTPDGNVRMYTTASDIGTARWATSNETTSLNSNTDGDGNTIGLVNFPSAVTYDAAQACYDSSADGYYDWYLPALNELSVLYANRTAIGNFDTGGFYWSSSENSSNNARELSFVNGASTNYNKGSVFNIRCVRSDNSKLTEIVPTGLIRHWRLDETAGSLAVDSSGNGGDVAYQGMNPASNTRKGMVASAQYFTASNHIMSDAIDLGNEFTLASWVKLDSPTSTAQGIFANSQEGNFDGFKLYVNSWATTDGELVFETSNGTTQNNGSTTGANIAPNSWAHVAAVVNKTGGAVTLYVNGVDLTSDSAISSTFNSNEELWAGRFKDAGGFLTGSLDDLRVYNRLLTASEVQEIYEARNGIRYNETANVPEFFDGDKFKQVMKASDVPDGLVAHWKLDETTGTTAVDSSGNGNDASMIGNLSADTHSAPGAVGRSLNFTGAETYITVTGSGFPTGSGTPFTMSAWAQSDIFTGHYGTILLWGRDNDSSYTRPNMRMLELTGNMYLRVGVGNNIYNDYVLSGYDVNTFEHYTVTYDGTDMEAFRNGVSMGAWTPASPINAPDDYAVIGSRNNGGSFNQLFRGSIDDVRLYDRVLSNDEIMTLYAMGAPYGQNKAAPQGCPNIGDVCDDGSIYAGISPDGSIDMYTTPEDAGLMNFNNGVNNYTDASTGTTGTATGESNTAYLVITDSDSVAAGVQLHNAAQYCYDLVAHGRDDWYLGAEDEMTVIYNNYEAIGNFDDSGEEYWTSRDPTGSNAGRTIRFNDGVVDGSNKDVLERVRCISKGPAPRCANPYGLEGSMFYNTTHDVMQYCDGGRWVGIGKQN
ncbi:MAG TPA: DUF1566 domain-containing protein [Micavibrio sp.]|nr:DUF1566 domain-containing protein [Micavibrio sp.]HIL28652.1 DUF1566 domain-containing protein [Micavibrio sp.]